MRNFYFVFHAPKNLNEMNVKIKTNKWHLNDVNENKMYSRHYFITIDMRCVRYVVQ